MYMKTSDRKEICAELARQEWRSLWKGGPFFVATGDQTTDNCEREWAGKVDLFFFFVAMDLRVYFQEPIF